MVSQGDSRLASDATRVHFIERHYLEPTDAAYQHTNIKTCCVANLPTDRLIGFSRISKQDGSTISVFARTHPDYCAIGVGRWLIAVSDYMLMSQLKSGQSRIVERQISASNRAARRLLERATYRLHTQDDAEQQLIWQKELKV